MNTLLEKDLYRYVGCQHESFIVKIRHFIFAPGFRYIYFFRKATCSKSIIGKNFNISQCCLIGNSQGKFQGSPVIGNNVCVNANSIIVGGVHIGNDVLIAPGAFVNFDVPDNSIVIGNPGKIIHK